MLRRRAALSIRMNALISLKPSESEMKSLISAIDTVLPLEPYGAEAFGEPSKKNSTGTCRIWDICCNRLAPMRLAALSYFCTCWKVRPSAAASFSWLIASIRRRIRNRLPTCWSTGLGAFFRGNGKRTAMADRSLKLLSKNRPDAGTFDIPIQRIIFGQGLCNIMPIARDYSPAPQSFLFARPMRAEHGIEAKTLG